MIVAGIQVLCSKDVKKIHHHDLPLEHCGHGQSLTIHIFIQFNDFIFDKLIVMETELNHKLTQISGRNCI